MASVLSSLFGDNSVQGLETKAKDILAVFQSTVDGLTAVNVQAEQQKKEKEEAIAKAQAEAGSLQALLEKNNKVIEKINNILGD